MRKPLIHWDCKSRIATLVVLFLLLAPPVFAEWYKDYEDAMGLIKKNSWAAAIPKLQAAISQKQEEGSNIKFYGMKFADYYPHYYLGLAYFSTGDLSAAVREFERSEFFGEIQRKKDLHKKLTDMRSLAGAQLLAKTMLKNPEAGTIPAPALKPPEEAPAQPPSTENETKVAQESVIETKEPESATPKQPDAAAQKPAPTLTPPTPMETDPEAEKKMTRAGARKYFEGKYDDAISLLHSAIQMNQQDASAQFLLGCSYAAKYLLSGSQDQELIRKAYLAFQKCKQLDPEYQGVKNPYISPAVIEIYQKVS